MVVFPAPFGPSSAKIFPRSTMQVDSPDRVHVAVGLGQPAYLDRDAVVLSHLGHAPILGRETGR